MKPYLYETHLHTSPVSRCAIANVRDTLEFYKSIGYAGVFITNHFIDGNINYDISAPYEEKINFYFSDYENALQIGKEIGINVFLGVESSYGGTDFLIYGLDKEWFLNHPEVATMDRKSMLTLMQEEGALVIQAHPFNESFHIDHIRLFPRQVHGIEVFNGNRPDFENEMSELYAKHYGLIRFAGSDNHSVSNRTILGGMESETPVIDEADFIKKVKNGEMTPFNRSVSSFK